MTARARNQVEAADVLRMKAWPPMANPIPDWRRASGDSSNGAMIVSTYCELVERLMFESGPPDISSERPRRLVEGIAFANRRTLCSTSGGSPLARRWRSPSAPHHSCPSGRGSARVPTARDWRWAARREGREAPAPRPAGRPSSRATPQAETAPRREARDARPGSAPQARRLRRLRRPVHTACRRARRAAPGRCARNLAQGGSCRREGGRRGRRPGSALARRGWSASASPITKKTEERRRSSSVRNRNQLPAMTPVPLPLLPRIRKVPPISWAAGP